MSLLSPDSVNGPSVLKVGEQAIGDRVRRSSQARWLGSMRMLRHCLCAKTLRIFVGCRAPNKPTAFFEKVSAVTLATFL